MWAVRVIIVRNVSYAKTVLKLYAPAVTDARNVPLSAPTAVKNVKTVRTAVFAETAAPALIVWAETVTTVLTVTFANSVWITSASDVERAARNVPLYAPSVARSVRTARMMSCAATVRCALPAAAARGTTVRNAACAKCAWILSATTATDARSAPTSARSAVKNALIALNLSCALSAAFALTVRAERETTAPNVCYVKTVWTRSATAVTGAPTAPSYA